MTKASTKNEQPLLYSLSAELKKAEKLGDVSRCIEICRRAMSLVDSRNYDQFYMYGVKLVGFLIGQPDPVPSLDIEEAIRILRRLERCIPSRESQKQANNHRNLGLAYQMRREGDRGQNLIRAKKHYERALSVFTKTRNPHDWALSKAALAEVYAYLKSVPADLNIRKSINHLRGALSIYNAKDFPEEFKDYSEALDLMRHRLRIQRNARTNR